MGWVNTKVKSLAQWYWLWDNHKVKSLAQCDCLAIIWRSKVSHNQIMQRSSQVKSLAQDLIVSPRSKISHKGGVPRSKASHNGTATRSKASHNVADFQSKVSHRKSWAAQVKSLAQGQLIDVVINREVYSWWMFKSLLKTNLLGSGSSIHISHTVLPKSLISNQISSNLVLVSINNFYFRLGLSHLYTVLSLANTTKINPRLGNLYRLPRPVLTAIKFIIIIT
jgi:hypothetical protein